MRVTPVVRGQTGVRPGSDRGQTGSDRGQTGVQTRVRPGSDHRPRPRRRAKSSSLAPRSKRPPTASTSSWTRRCSSDERRLRVVHGHGTGRLRDAVRTFFRAHPLVANVSPAARQRRRRRRHNRRIEGLMALFPQSFLDDLKSQTNIVSLISDVVPLKKMGATWKGLCPFHQERTPSFNVNGDKGFFKCFRMRRRGRRRQVRGTAAEGVVSRGRPVSGPAGGHARYRRPRGQERPRGRGRTARR